TKKQLSEQEIAYICDCLKTGKNVPVKYKDTIFEEEKRKQEYELTYGCKERENDIIADTWATPLQKVKSYGQIKNGQRENKLIFGDNLQILKTILNDDKLKKEIEKNGGIKLIYIDPPFATKSDFRNGEGEKVYGDKIAGAEFVEFLRKRLIIIREILADDGSLYIHLDSKKCHYMKIILDEIFGEYNFRNHIARGYQWGGVGKTQFANKHDDILRYTKSGKRTFNEKEMREPYKTKDTRRHNNEDGKLLRDIWDDIPIINTIAKERNGYPTQKPEQLLERIIKASSNKGDIVLDAFAGSGTTFAVAEKLGRKRIGIDCGKLAIYTIQNRLMNLGEEIGNNGNHIEPKAFSVYNAGLYDYKILQSLDWDGYVDFSLALFQAKKDKHKVNGVELDGYIGVDHVQVFNYNHGRKGIGLDYNYIKNIHDIIGKKITKKFYIICPALKVEFIEDVVKYDNVEYYILRIPYSIISELHKRPFDKIRQPASENDVNNTIDAVGFDFIKIPKIELEYKKSDYSIRIKTFESKIISKKPLELQNLESLSMVIIDYEYNGEYVDFEEVLYADQIKKNDYKISLDKNRLKQDCMIIYIDIFGNEKREIISLKSFR
ncbi:MAG: site-specific DNA-methyltransferase, partial [Candidatus Absconditabacterales bacterium]